MRGSAQRVWVGLVTAFVIPSLGCGDDVPPVIAPTDAEIAQAQAIYEDQSCGVCHGETADGGEIGPALRDLAPYWDVERLTAYLRDPDGFRSANPDFDARRTQAYDMEMPAYDELSDEDSRVLLGWLLSR